MMETDQKAEERRGFIKQTAVLGVGLVAAASLVSGKARAAADKIRWGFAIDLTRCTGCKACTVACKTENGVPLGITKQPNPESGTPTPVRRGWVVVDNSVAKARTFSPRICNQCAAPPCLTNPVTEEAVCPVAPILLGLEMPDKSVVEYEARATYQRPDGLVMIDKERCIGCGDCVMACPYQARYQSPLVFYKDDRAKGIADKCDLCEHRVAQGLQPACVETCPGGARIAGNLDDPNDPIRAWLDKPGAWLKTSYGTDPKVWYVGATPE